MSSGPPRNEYKPSEVLAAFIDRSLAAKVVVSMEPLVGGDLNESVIISVDNGERFVARRPLSPRSPWAPGIGGQVAAHRLATAAGAPVPQVVAWDSTALLYRYVRGQPISPGAALWRDIADLDGEEIDPETAYAAGLIYGRLHARGGTGRSPSSASPAAATADRNRAQADSTRIRMTSARAAVAPMFAHLAVRLSPGRRL